MNKPLLISIDGNIGAGKTTVLNALREACPDLHLVKEPVQEWMNMNDDKAIDKKLTLPAFFLVK
jgi:deoxyadenosine/deoxycytidine kinase